MEMGKRALLVVDVQNGFCEGGSMGVKGGNQVAQDVAELLRDTKRMAQYHRVVFTRDWHDPSTDNGGHFAHEGEAPDFDTTWPVHCVRGTNDAAFHNEISGLYRDEVISKGMDEPAYSGFEGQTFAGTDLSVFLWDAEVTEVDVVGIATDYCVKATALDAAAYGFDTTVLMDLTAAVDPANEHTLPAFEAAGVKWVV